MNNLNPDKGQHVLIDNSIVDLEIKTSNIKKSDKIIEIGAGSGILTQKLAENILIKAILSDIKYLILIIGDSFKELLLSNEKIGIISQRFYHISLIKEIKKDAFHPPPRTSSWLFHLKRKGKIKELDASLLNIIKKKGKIKK